MRRCTSFEAGKAGVEAWAARHVDRLRGELADPAALLRQLRGEVGEDWPSPRPDYATPTKNPADAGSLGARRGLEQSP